jgi:transcriptional regulator with XRE-family HTH domain
MARKAGSLSRDSIGWFANEIMSGNAEAKAHLNSALLSDAHPTYSVPGNQTLAVRRSQPVGLNITHWPYQYPRIWGEPGYSLYRVQVRSSPLPEFFMWHSGEELLFPTTGDVTYEFFWPRGKKRFLPETVHAGSEGAQTNISAIRILPNVPHRNWGVENTAGEPAAAWMVIRHLSGSTAPLDAYTDPKVDSDSEEKGKVSAGDLNDSNRAFLLLADLPGRLTVARMRAGYSVTELAKQVNVHPSYIWRLERGASNVGIHTLKNVAEWVGLDLTDVAVPQYFDRLQQGTASSDFEAFEPFSTTCTNDLDNGAIQKENQTLPGVTWRKLLHRVTKYDHWIHGHIFTMEADSRIPLACEYDNTKPDLYLDSNLGPYGKQSWILLQGEVMFENSRTMLSPTQNPVVHLNNGARGSFKAYMPSVLLHIEYSARCTCEEPRFRTADRIGC